MIIFAKICKSKYYKDFILLFVHPAPKSIDKNIGIDRNAGLYLSCHIDRMGDISITAMMRDSSLRIGMTKLRFVIGKFCSH